MKNIEIKNQLFENLTLGINIYWKVKIISEKKLKDYINGECDSILKSYSEKMPDGFHFSRKLYRAFHIDPTKHRPSSEALWRRLKNKSDFPSVNPVVDLTNLLSLKFQICFGLYDIDKISGGVEVSIGAENDSYQGIRKDTLNFKGKMVLRDQLGPFGNPSSDSIRTSTGHTSKNILQVLFFHKEDSEAERINTKTNEIFKQFFHMEDSKTYLIKRDSIEF